MEPVTRAELFMAAAAGQEVSLPEPVTRVEKFLSAVVEKVAGGDLVADVVATPGQMIIVKAVDENGKPVAWEAADRTHWVESGGRAAAILEETTATGADGELGLETDITLEIGVTYQIVYNGTAYECVAIDGATVATDAAGLVFCGNADFIMGTGDNGMPFVFLYYSGQGFMIVDLNGASSCTIAIYEAGETVHKLDNKFIDAEWMATRKAVKGDVVLEEAEHTFQVNTVYDTPCSTTTILGAIPVTLGNSYAVTYDGTDYICECKDIGGNYFMGNGDVVDPTAGYASTEPFLILIVSTDTDGAFVRINISDTENLTHTISIHEWVEVINKLPEEFLPDGIGGGDEPGIIIRVNTSGSGIGAWSTSNMTVVSGSEEQVRTALADGKATTAKVIIDHSAGENSAYIAELPNVHVTVDYDCLTIYAQMLSASEIKILKFNVRGTSISTFTYNTIS